MNRDPSADALIAIVVMVLLGALAIVLAKPPAGSKPEKPAEPVADVDAIADGLTIESDDPRLPYGGGF
jgi:hypothetical protein